jgi:UDP-N-acetylglucosamine 3-dehydrogenase
VRVGLIGLGVMGKNHLRVLQSLDAVENVVIYDSAPVNITDNRKVDKVESLEEFIDSPLDYAVIALPTIYHGEVSIALAEKSIPTLLEKPVATSLRQAIAIEDAFTKTGTICKVGHIERFNPALSLLKEKISQGLVGDLLQISTIRTGPFPNRISDVGVVRDLASHDIDLTMWLTGSNYKSLKSSTRQTRGDRHEDLFLAVGTIGNETLVSHTVNWVTPRKVRETAILGTNGLLVADSLKVELRLFENGDSHSEWGQYSNMRGVTEGSEIKFAVPAREPLVLEHEAMISEVNGEQSRELCSLEAGIEVMRVIENILGE